MHVSQRPIATVAVTGLHRGESPQPGSAVAASLRRANPAIRIIGLSYDTMESGIFSTGLDTLDAVYAMPFPGTGADAWRARLGAIAARDPIDLLIPCLDSELPVLMSIADTLETLGIACCLPARRDFARREKSRLPELCAEAGVSTPRTVALHSADEIDRAAADIGMPAYVKGAHCDAQRVTNLPALRMAFAELSAQWGTPVLLQEALTGEEYNVVGLGDGDGRILGACAIRKTLRSRAGKGFAGIVIDDPVLTHIATSLIATLKWDGPFELEFLLPHGTDEYRLLEINPRFPAWVDFPAQLGCNLPAALLDLMRSGTVPAPAACPPGRIFIRHCIDYAGDIADLAALGHAGQLARAPRAAQAFL
jgi:carbamoyl-phosphate synthase large subunit